MVDELSQKEQSDSIYYYGEVKKLDNKFMLLSCVNSKAIKLNNNNLYYVYNFVLENSNPNSHYGIYANGILVESMSENTILNMMTPR